MTRAPDETDAARAARWGRLKELFAAALEFPRSRRDGFVTEACGDDPELRTELQAHLDTLTIEPLWERRGA